MVNILSLEGLFLKREKVDSVLKMKPASNTNISNFASIVELLMQLTCQKANFVCNESAFGRIKNFIYKVCCIFIRCLKPKLLLTPASKVWVLFCFKTNPWKKYFLTNSFCESFVIERRDQIFPKWITGWPSKFQQLIPVFFSIFSSIFLDFPVWKNKNSIA